MKIANRLITAQKERPCRTHKTRCGSKYILDLIGRAPARPPASTHHLALRRVNYLASRAADPSRQADVSPEPHRPYKYSRHSCRHGSALFPAQRQPMLVQRTVRESNMLPLAALTAGCDNCVRGDCRHGHYRRFRHGHRRIWLRLCRYFRRGARPSSGRCSWLGDATRPNQS